MKSDEEELLAIALRGVQGLGDRGYRLLIDRYGSAVNVYRVRPQALRAEGLVGKVLEERLARGPDRRGAREQLARSRAAGHCLLTYGAEGYPEALARIYDPPALVHVWGRLPPAREPGAIAIVGSRKATVHGREVARELGRALTEAGFSVVSGLAAGIDTAAHEGAIDGGGRTVAVLGSGLDVIYPRGNLRLARRIVETGGAIVSEHPPGTRPDARYFPRRNRIISGLCRGVIVVEAAEKSGSLITASLALEQGREVFAVPGLAGAHVCRGTHNLLRQGAALVESAADVLEVFGLAPCGAAPGSADPPAPMGETARRMWGSLEEAPLSIEILIAASGLGADQAQAALMELVVEGRARRWPGNQFSRIQP